MSSIAQDGATEDAGISVREEHEVNFFDNSRILPAMYEERRVMFSVIVLARDNTVCWFAQLVCALMNAKNTSFKQCLNAVQRERFVLDCFMQETGFNVIAVHALFSGHRGDGDETGHEKFSAFAQLAAVSDILSF